MPTQYQQLIDLGGDQKLLAASEVGSAPLPDLLQAYEADWSWFCVWGDSFIHSDSWNPISVLTEVSFAPTWSFLGVLTNSDTN